MTGEASRKHEDLLRTYAGSIRAYPVSTRVNKPENDEPAYIEPITLRA